MRVKLFMMMKNEDDLLQPWIRYHAHLVGPENLIIFDNGSESENVQRVVKWARRFGVKIDQSYRKVEDWINQGEIYSIMVREMDRKKEGDFYFFMDCDEFLAVEHEGSVRISKESLQEELSRYAASQNALLIHGALDNSPKRAGHFRWSPQVKNFFAADACDYVVTGFHIAKSKVHAPAQKTKIAFVHYHFKPYETYVQHAKAKIAPWIKDFSRESLIDYVARKDHGHHCASIMLMSKEEYEEHSGNAGCSHFPEVAAAFAAVGEPLPFVSGRVAPDDETRWRPLTDHQNAPWYSLKRFLAVATAHSRKRGPARS